MTFAEWGFPRMAARVLMTMMSADQDALTAAELADRLAVSPPAISSAVRYLMQLGLLERRPVPGSRRVRYQVRDDAWYTSALTKGGAYKILGDLAEDGVRALGGPDSPSGARVDTMRDFFRFVQNELADVQERWGNHRKKK